METLHLTLDRSRENGLLNKTVNHVKESRPIKPNTIIMVDGEPLIVFGRFSRQHDEIKKRLVQIKYRSNSRIASSKLEDNARWFKTDNRVRFQALQFCYKGRKAVFNLPASACLFNNEYPTTYEQLIDLGQELSLHYEMHSPVKFANQATLADQIQPQWKIPGTFFTQGIVNDTATYQYHYDKGNFHGCWSCMAVFKRDISGGELFLPALNAHLNIEDETFVLFDGQSLLHGVSPITKTTRFGRRFSIVYYGLRIMANCGTFDEEIQKLRDSDIRKHEKAYGV